MNSHIILIVFMRTLFRCNLPVDSFVSQEFPLKLNPINTCSKYTLTTNLSHLTGAFPDLEDKDRFLYVN